MKLQLGLRARLVLLVMTAVLPLLGWSVYNAVRESRNEVAQTRQNMLSWVTLAAAYQDQVAESARTLLAAIAQAPAVENAGEPACTAYLQKLRSSFPAFNNVGITDTQGVLRCQALGPLTARVALDDRTYIKDAIERRSFVVGEYIVGRMSGRDSLPFAMPVINSAGQVTGVAYAALDLVRLGDGLTQLPVPPGARFTLIDRFGVLLASAGDEPTPLGSPVTSAPLMAALAGGKAGFSEGIDGEGRDRIYAFTPTRAGAGGVFVGLSIDRAQIASQSRRFLVPELLSLAAVMALGVWLAGLLSRRAIIEPTHRILEATRRLKTGQRDARVEGLDGTAAYEFGRIAAGFNLMAESLQLRQRDLEAELANSRQAYTTVELILNSMQEGLMALDADGQSLLSNDAASRIFPADLSGVPVEQWAARLGLFNTSGRPCTPEDLPHVRALHGEAGSGVDLLVRTAQLPAGRTLRCSYRPILNAEGITGALVVFSDITDLQRLQGEQQLNVQQLRETQRRLVEALHIGGIGNWELDIATGSLWWSDEVYELFGYAAGAFLPTVAHVEQHMHPEDQVRHSTQRAVAIARNEPLDIEFRLILPDGRVRWLHQIGKSYFNDAGVPVRRAGVVQDITERKQADAELVLLHNAVSRINDIVLIAEAATRDRPSLPIVFVNEAFERLTGFTAAETLGNEPMILQGVGTDAKAAQRIETALTTRQALREEVQIYSKAGQAIWIELDLVPLVDDTGWNTHWIAVMRDISGRKVAERALIESEQRYQALFDLAPLPMWVFDVETARFLAVNEAATQLYGYSRDEFNKLTIDAIRPESERDRVRQRLVRGFSGKPEQWLHSNRYGAEFPVEVVSSPISYAGRTARFVVSHDISTRVKAERELQEHLFTLQRSADAAQALVQHQTLQGVLNELVEQGCGVVRAHLAVVTLRTGEGWSDAVTAMSLSDKYAAYRDRIDEPDGSGVYAEVCETNRPMRLTHAALEAHPRWGGAGNAADRRPPMRGLLAVPLIGTGGANIGVLQLSDKYEGDFTAQDEYVAFELAQLASIAIGNAQLLEQVRELNAGLERKVSERTVQLAREEARYRALAEEAPQVVWNFEPGRGVTYFNRAWYDLVGGSAREWLGEEPWQAAVHPDDRDAVLENWRHAQATLTPFVGIRRLLAKDGTYRTTSYRGVPVLDDRQTVVAWVGIDADITDIKAIEEALRQSNRELEAFSYSVSHDLRSPLNSIDGFSRLLARQLEGKINEQGAHYLARIQAGVSHMGQLIEGLLSLAQVSRASLRTETVDISTLAREAIERCQQREPDRQVTVRVEDGMTLPGDTRLFRVVLDNLVGNAWKFTSRRVDASITISTTGAPWTFFVQDNGAGFDMAYADKLFGVFQRLHSARDFPGTGVGLATVQRIIVRHHGRIWAQSEPGVGTTFYFTVAENTAASGEVAAADASTD